jgi:hypothetical protein
MNMAKFTNQNKLYGTDFYGWAIAMSKALHERDIKNLDWDNLSEEIASLGKQEKRELVNRLIILLMHLLKWEYQIEKRTKSWAATIKVQRKEIKKHLLENPSLKPYLSEAIESAYDQSRIDAAKETGLDLDIFTELCPYSWSEIKENY